MVLREQVVHNSSKSHDMFKPQSITPKTKLTFFFPSLSQPLTSLTPCFLLGARMGSSPSTCHLGGLLYFLVLIFIQLGTTLPSSFLFVVCMYVHRGAHIQLMGQPVAVGYFLLFCEPILHSCHQALILVFYAPFPPPPTDLLFRTPKSSCTVAFIHTATTISSLRRSQHFSNVKFLFLSFISYIPWLFQKIHFTDIYLFVSV